MRHSLPWFRFRDSRGDEWTTALATSAMLYELMGEECAGLTHYQWRVVMVDAGLTRDQQDEVLLHEMCHVAAGEKPEGLPVAQEEKAVYAISPRLWPLLKMLGFSWPKRPRGVRALEKLARAYHEDALRCLVWEQTHERIRVDRR